MENKINGHTENEDVSGFYKIIAFLVSVFMITLLLSTAVYASDRIYLHSEVLPPEVRWKYNRDWGEIFFLNIFIVLFIAVIFHLIVFFFKDLPNKRWVSGLLSLVSFYVASGLIIMVAFGKTTFIFPVFSFKLFVYFISVFFYPKIFSFIVNRIERCTRGGYKAD